MLRKRAHLEHRKSDHLALSIDLLQHLVVRGLPKMSFFPLEYYLQIVALRVVPHFYVFVLYKTVPFLGLSVRYAGQHEGVAGFKFHHHAYELIVYPRS